MNATLASLVADVCTLTNRPDLVGETALAVRNATLKAHNTDFYDKDLLESGIQFNFPNTQQSIEYKSLVPRWRALKYLRKYKQSNNSGHPDKFLEIVTPDNVLDSYSINKEDICYLAGVELKIRTIEANQFFLLGCYIHPNVTSDNYASWIAQEQPAAIVYAAAATVFKTIGFDEQVATYNTLVADEYSQLKISNISTVGY